MTRYTRYTFCEITERYLAIIGSALMSTYIPGEGLDFKNLFPVLHLHYMTKILTSIGLDREAVGVQLECRADVLKETMFMIQDHMRKILQRGW